MINFNFSMGNPSVSSTLIYTLHFYAQPKTSIIIEQFVQQRLSNWIDCFAGLSAELSLKNVPKNCPVSIEYLKFSFDPYYHPNLSADEWKQYEKYQLTFHIRPQPSCQFQLDVARRQLFDIYFGHVQAFVRAVLSQAPNRCKVVNDNFLNFTDQTRFNVQESYRRLMKLGEMNRKCHELICLVRDQLASHPDPETICLSFNGGKDCTALLHVIATLFHHREEKRRRFQLMLIKTVDQFEELDLYVQRVAIFYHCELKTFSGNSLKSTLHKVKQNKRYETVFMGVRRSDLPAPMAEQLCIIQRTDVEKGWADFIRVSPLLDWTYSEVWRLLIDQAVPYCPLYNYGYTSIDTPTNTIPNDTLKIHLEMDQIDEKHGYLPAYLLQQDSLERCNRT